MSFPFSPSFSCGKSMLDFVVGAASFLLATVLVQVGHLDLGF